MSLRNEHQDDLSRRSQLLRALMSQERAALRFEDHLLLREKLGKSAAADNSGAPASSAAPHFHNEIWRERVCGWFHRVVDGVGACRDVAFHAASLLDRYLAVAESSSSADGNGRNADARAYQVAATTALLLAAKLYGGPEGAKLRAADLVAGSGGRVETEALAACARRMLSSLPSWRHTPPAPSGFVRSVLRLLPPSLGSVVLTRLLNEATHLAELAACDSNFMGERPSVIGYAASIRAVDACALLGQHDVTAFHAAVENASGLRVGSPDVERALQRMPVLNRERRGEDDGRRSLADDVSTEVVHVVPCEQEEVDAKRPPMDELGFESVQDAGKKSVKTKRTRGESFGAQPKRRRHVVVVEG